MFDAFKVSRLETTEACVGRTYGGISEISVLEPEPGLVGLIRVVSTSVQPSPLSPQDPVMKVIDQAVGTKLEDANPSAGSWTGRVNIDISISTEEATYAMAEMSGPPKVTVPPVESVWPLAFSRGYEVNVRSVHRCTRSNVVQFQSRSYA